MQECSVIIPRMKLCQLMTEEISRVALQRRQFAADGVVLHSTLIVTLIYGTPIFLKSDDEILLVNKELGKVCKDQSSSS